MRVRIEHQTVYKYDHSVYLNPTILRLTPRADSCRLCNNCSLNITPTPSGLSSYYDACGNIAHTAWFTDATMSLEIAAVMEMETFRENPFNYIVTDPGALVLPLKYKTGLKYLLQPSLGCPEVNKNRPGLDRIVKEEMTASDNNTLEFLSRFCNRLSFEVAHEIRETGEPLAPEDTLSRRKGACRDVAMVFIEGCRLVGIAARFVSGYKCRKDKADIKYYMHAWAEVFLPGAGWRGYDPSIGLAVADEHVPLAASPISSEVSPVDGSFRSDIPGIHSEMNVNVNITFL
ncbi:MAG TPA: transglutaminase [Fibrobacteres bacterium]|nr:transglutaminase [Fibrobacterota bacterium]